MDLKFDRAKEKMAIRGDAPISKEIKSENIVNAANEHIPDDFHCPTCGNDDKKRMELLDNICKIPIFPYKDESKNVNDTYPASPLTCLKCGHIEFFNSVVWDLLEHK